MKNAKSRFLQSEESGTQNFIPDSALKVSPYILEKIKALKAEIGELHEEPKNKENLITLEVRTQKFISKLTSTHQHINTSTKLGQRR